MQATWERKDDRVIITKGHEEYSFSLGCSYVKWHNLESKITQHFNYFIGDEVIRIRTGPTKDYQLVVALHDSHPVYIAFMDAVTEKELLDTISTESNYY